MATLDFKGKQHVYAHHLTVPYRPLIRDTELSMKPAESDDNLIIHGDNLHALKALLPRYASKVKCIYIDPPYNTGNEGWIYDDNVNSPLIKEWFAQQSPVDGEDLERHDKWLCMMWPRLHLLKELLADDGVIFVSIDSNELHHLRMLMDEVFGALNYVETFIWCSRLGIGATSKNTATVHEYVLAYSKSSVVADFKEVVRQRDSPTRERLRQWGQGDRREDRPTMYFPILTEKYGEVYPIRPDGSDGRWRVGQTTMVQLLKKGLVEYEEQSDGRIEAYKVIPSGTATKTAYPSIFDPDVVKTTAQGTKELKEILPDSQFPYPKPTSLIKEIVSLCTNHGDVILDSFAGSGTTAHAVLALNQEDRGNRRFILVEREDYADIITAERVRRVICGVSKARGKSLRAGFGGSFTYCTLGNPIGIEGMLTGSGLPDYSTLAAYLLYVSAGVSAGDATLQPENEDGLFFSSDTTNYYLLYQPDIGYLSGNEAMLNEERARRISASCRETGVKAIVFGPGKYIGQRDLTSMDITFCQLPYEIHKTGE